MGGCIWEEGREVSVSYLPIDILARSLDIARLAVDATIRICRSATIH